MYEILFKIKFPISDKRTEKQWITDKKIWIMEVIKE